MRRLLAVGRTPRSARVPLDPPFGNQSKSQPSGQFDGRKSAGLLTCATRILSVGIVFAVSAFAQEAEPGDPWLGWKWANFAILAVGLGYLISKHAPAFFQQRSKEIQQGIQEATQAKQEAEARAAEIDRRLAGLDSEIEKLRAGARAEIAAEGERIGHETEGRLQRIQTQSAQEIEMMSRGARDELRKYAAQLALDLAQQRIRSRMTKDVDDGLVNAFLQDLHLQSPGARN
jgi:F-type H+-transporting ATPase subunit b